MASHHDDRADAALDDLRAVVKGQLGSERPPSPELDPRQAVRFSPELPASLAPEEEADLRSRAAALDPWLQGPFYLGGNLMIGGAWRNDERWATLEGVVPATSPASECSTSAATRATTRSCSTCAAPRT